MGKENLSDLFGQLKKKYPWARLPDLPLVGEKINEDSYRYGTDRILKFCLKPIWSGRNIKSVLKFLQLNPSPHYAKVFDFEVFSQENHCWYLIEDLTPLGEQELQCFQRLILSKKNYGEIAKRQRKFLRGLARRKEVRNYNLLATQVMKDQLGRYKITDLDTLR
jgi:hypothetical protein